MGQYYKPVVLNQDWKENEKPVAASLLCYDFGNGAKLMEHSYVGNNFVNAAIEMIKIVGGGKAVPFVWVGDYADPVETKNHPVKLDKDGYIDGGGIDIFECACDFIYKDGGSSDDKTKEYKELLQKVMSSDPKGCRYIVNETKREFVKVPKLSHKRYQIHPLPILCSSGNGRGGGDYGYYESKNKDVVGRWAYDEIRITDEDPEPLGYKHCGWRFECER